MPRGKDGLHSRRGVFGFRYQDSDGEWREKSCATNNRKAARLIHERFLKELADGRRPTEMADWRLEQAEEWWNEYRRPRIAEGTKRSEPYIVKHLRRIVGNKRLREITNHNLDRYVTARLAGYEYQTAEGKKVSMAPAGAWSINKECRLWSMILRKAKLWHRLADDYRPLKTKASDIGQAATHEQLRHLAEVAETNSDWEAAFYGSVLAANSGLRGGEIKKLRIRSVDLERRCLRIRRADAKTDASARFIELNRDAAEAAARLLFRAQMLGASKPEHYLMPKNLSRIAHGPQKGKRRGYDPLQHQESWDTAWAALTKEAGLPGFRFHDLRHTFITRMVELGAPLGVIQTFVGHLSARMVRHYTHVSSGAARKAVELLDSHSVLADTLTAKAEPGARPAASLQTEMIQ